MRIQHSIRRFTAIMVSLVLFCGAIFTLPAAASSLEEGECSGLPENAVADEIRITSYGAPNAAQLTGLREDAMQKVPDGFLFYGWVVTSDSGSQAVADSELESQLHALCDDLPEGESSKLVLQYLYIPAQEAAPDSTAGSDSATAEETSPAASEETTPEADGVSDTQTGEQTTASAAADQSSQTGNVLSTVPLYFQNDYPYTMYGSGTVASSGCSITSLAMVATYMTNHMYLPDELAHYFGGRAVNNVARLEYGSKALQLPFEKAENWHVTYQALKEGKVAIVLMGPESIFTNSQHFIVLTGISENGKIMVNDSNRDNYSFWQLRDAFECGFDPEDILLGYNGAWIYDKSAMPEDPFIYHEEEPERGEPRYPDIQLTQEDVNLLAKVVWVEAQGECAEGQQAVAEVALNRIASGDFPNNLHDVIYGEGQFRSVPRLDEAEPFQAQYEAIERAIYGPYVLPEGVVYFATTPTNDNVWGRIGGHIFCYGNG